MTILEALKADHDAAKALLTRILREQDGKARSAMFQRFKIEITAHSRSEEKVFYRRLESTDKAKGLALEGFVEHEVADRLVADLSRSRNKISDQWTARITVLQELLHHHIEEEEGEFFDAARKLFDKVALEKMGKEFVAEKRRHGVRPDPDQIAAE